MTTIAMPRASSPAASAALEAAVLRTVAYADVFDFALTPSEIHRYLVGEGMPALDVAVAVAGPGTVLGGRADRVDGHVTLIGRGSLAMLRAERSAQARTVLPRAIRYARAVGSLPFVRMVAISGALAASNAVPGADIDLFIVTEPGHLWTARAGAIAIVRFAGGRGDELCPNYLVTESALDLDEHDLYAASELARLIPVVGRSTYDDLRAANPWAGTLLPNAADPPAAVRIRQPVLGATAGLAERVLRTPPGAAFERWEQRRKVGRFRAQAAEMLQADAEVAFSADRCKGHFVSHRRVIREAYEARCVALAIEPMWTVDG